MTEFNPLLDLSKKTSEELNDGINKLNERIAYFEDSDYSYLSQQLSMWRELYYQEISNRAMEQARAKESKDIIIFDTEPPEEKSKEDESKSKNT